MFGAGAAPAPAGWCSWNRAARRPSFHRMCWRGTPGGSGMFGMSAGATTLFRWTMAAVNAGAPSRPLPPRKRTGTAQAPPSPNPVHPSGVVQLILTLVDSPPPVRDTWNVDVVSFPSLYPQIWMALASVTYIHMDKHLGLVHWFSLYSVCMRLDVNGTCSIWPLLGCPFVCVHRYVNGRSLIVILNRTPP